MVKPCELETLRSTAKKTITPAKGLESHRSKASAKPVTIATSVVFLAATLVAGATYGKYSHPASSCDPMSVYNKEQRNLQVTRLEAEPLLFKNGRPWFGADGKRYFKTVASDQTKPGPWTTQIFVQQPAVTPLLVTVANYQHVHAYWSDEHELAISVWWGRIAETTFYIDTENAFSEKGWSIRAEDTNHAQEIESCPENQAQ